MTKFDCDNPGPLGLRQELEKELGDYFSSSSFCASEKLLAENPWLAFFIDHAFTQKDVVISLNYDCVLEGALDLRVKWTPNRGYGSHLNHPSSVQFPESPVTVLKIHGSASFRIAPFANAPGAKWIGFIVNKCFFPRSAQNMDFGLFKAEGPYVIAPSYVKVPKVEMAYLMLDALAKSANADKLVVIGSALRKEDSFLTLIMTSFLRHPSWKTRKIIIVDPCADDISERIKNYWGVNVSNQIVPMKACLQDSVTDLVKFISKP